MKKNQTFLDVVQGKEEPENILGSRCVWRGSRLHVGVKICVCVGVLCPCACVSRRVGRTRAHRHRVLVYTSFFTKILHFLLRCRAVVRRYRAVRENTYTHTPCYTYPRTHPDTDNHSHPAYMNET